MTCLGNVFLNDQLGDCVIAGGYHTIGTITANAGNPFVASTSQVTADYSAIGGYILLLSFLFAVQDPAKVTASNGFVATIFSQAPGLV